MSAFLCCCTDAGGGALAALAAEMLQTMNVRNWALYFALRVGSREAEEAVGIFCKLCRCGLSPMCFPPTVVFLSASVAFYIHLVVPVFLTGIVLQFLSTECIRVRTFVQECVECMNLHSCM